MPGLVGIVSPHAEPATLSAMLATMVHEPFYSSGTLADHRSGVAVGWVQRRGSFSDCMPLWNATHDVCLVFHGEHFGNGPVGAQIDAPGARCAALLRGASGDRRAFLRSLNGWFHGVLIDARRGEAVLFNDRYGMQRTYCAEHEGAFYFASEAKALLRVLPELRELDLQGLADVMSFGCVLDDRTLFPRITLLPPGAAWTIRAGSVVDKGRYFRPSDWEGKPRVPDAEFYPRLRDTLTSVLPAYLASPQPIAMSLTGGLDTRMILANVPVRPGELPCYSFGGMYNESYDVSISRDIARRCGQDHRVLRVGASFLREFPALASRTVYISDGSLDVSGAADLYVNRLAREIAPVRLTGNYGSEILRGARHLKASDPSPGLFEPAFEREMDAAKSRLRTMWQGERVSIAAFRQAPWHHYNRLGVEQSQLTVRSPFLDNRLVELMATAPAGVFESSETSLRLIRDGNRKLAEVMTDRGVGGNARPVRSSATRAYREFLFKADYAFNYGMPQWLARVDKYAFAPLRAERLFLGRHKFHHFRVWFRDELSDFVKDVLLDHRSVSRPYLRRGALERIVRAHTDGAANYTTEITKLLTFELMQRQLIER